MSSRINSRNKGASGEIEAAKWLKRNLDLKLERNLEQTRDGGHDLVGDGPFCFEVKRVESLALRKWWLQVVQATTERYHIPVVMYRQNNQKWRFLISAKYIGLSKGYIQLEDVEFKKWANDIMTLNPALNMSIN